MASPLVLITISYISGLIAGHTFLYFPFSAAILAVSALVIGILLRRAERIPLRSIIIASIFTAAGWIHYLYSAAYLPDNHYTKIFEQDNRTHSVAGRIVSSLDRDPGRTAFVMDVKEMDGEASSGRLRVSVRDELRHAGYGDMIVARGRIFSPQSFKNPGAFDYPEYLARQGIYGILSVKDHSMIEVIESGRGIFRKIQDMRERIRRVFTASVSGPGSAILQAMVLGEEGGLTDEIRSRFMAAGVTHILSISGSHLGLVAILCFGLVKAGLLLLPERTYHRITLLTDPKKIAAGITVLPATFYALLAGGQTATMRSLIMIFFVLLSVITDRESRLMHSLAAAALIILIANPQAVLDISFQLSYISVLAIGYVVLLWNETRPQKAGWLDRARDSAVLLIAVSIATSIATGPLVAYYFNQISPAGIIANMIVVPFAGFVVVPLGLLTGIVSLFTGSLPLSSVNQAVSDLFYSAVRLFSDLPFAEFHPPAPPLPWLIGYFALVLSVAAYIKARLLYRTRPLEYSAGIPRLFYVGAAAGMTVLMFFLIFSLLKKRDTRVIFIDVGQGDSCLVELRTGERILIDGGGTYDNRFDIGRRIVAPFLWNRGAGRIDLIVVSHPHPDHINGLTSLLGLFDVGEIWVTGLDTGLPQYTEFTDAATQAGARIRTVSTLDRDQRIGSAVIRIVHPDPRFRPSGRRPYQSENSRSLVLRIDMEGASFLFTGDIEADAERKIIESEKDISCRVLKVPHHGSRSSSTPTFVEKTRPEIAVISSGAGNRFGHPHPDVLARWKAAGATIFRTDIHGAVFVDVRNSGLYITTWSGLVLTKIRLEDGTGWWTVEEENYKRLLIRIKNRVI